MSIPAPSPDGDAEFASASFTRPVGRPRAGYDPYAGSLALLALVGVIFLLENGRGRVLELVLIALAALCAYFAPVWLARAPAVAVTVTYLGLEGYYGRLSHDHYWTEVVVTLGIAALVSTAPPLRRARELRRIDAGPALLESEQADQTLRQLLGGSGTADSVADELDRARRYNHQVSLVLARLDDLQDTIELYGRLGSEKSLNCVAEVIAEHIRVTDVAFLRDPETFCVVLPETDCAGARVVGERMRLATFGRRIECGPGAIVDLGISIGIATFPDDAGTNEGLEQAALNALAHATLLGGNRTVLCSVPDGSPPGWGLGEPAVGAPAVSG
jgi:diguanylate cyclase (GGDEF)-like protein